MIIKILLVLIIFTNFLLGFFVLGQNPKIRSNRLFCILSVLAAFWTLANYMSGAQNSIFWLKSSYALGSFVITSGVFWTFTIVERKISKLFRSILIATSILFFILCYVPGFMSKSYEQAFSHILVPSTPGYGALIYLFYYLTVAYLILWNLLKKYRSTIDIKERAQFRLILTGAFIALLTSLISTLMPIIFQVTIWAIDAVGFLIFLIYVAYTITRHNLFNIKVIAIEIFTALLWVFILMRAFTAQTAHEAGVELFFLAITIVLGTVLIRTLLHEQKQTEHIEQLTRQLKAAYGELKSVDEVVEKAEKERGLV
jgi:hypothetical protein